MEFNALNSSFGRSTQPRTIPQQSNTHVRPTTTTRNLRATTNQPKNYYDTISYTGESGSKARNSKDVLGASSNAKYIQTADGDLSNLSAKQLRTLQNRLAQRAYRKKRSKNDDASLKSESASSPETSRSQQKLPKFEHISPIPSDDGQLSDVGLHSPFQPSSVNEGFYLSQSPSFVSESNAFRQSASQQDPLEQMSLHIEALEASNSQQQHTILEQQRMIQHLRAQVGGDPALFPSLPTSPQEFIPIDAYHGSANLAQIPQIQLPALDAYQALPEDFNFVLDEEFAPQQRIDQFQQQPHEAEQWINPDMSQLLADSP